MDHRFARIALTAALALCIVSSSAVAADKTSKAKEPPKNEAAKPEASKQDAMMEAMMKMAMPGPMHDLMKPMAGTFKATTKTWMAPGEPMVSEGTSENTWILGNRYLQTTFRGQMAGMPFEGFGLMGFDNMKKEFVSCWADNMGTGIAFSDGTADGSGKVLTMTSMMDDPTTGKQVPVKMITKVMDENQYMMTMSSMKDGKEHLDMEITYTRMK
jgi:uncharacterized protein DUF1579